MRVCTVCIVEENKVDSLKEFDHSVYFYTVIKTLLNQL